MISGASARPPWPRWLVGDFFWGCAMGTGAALQRQQLERALAMGKDTRLREAGAELNLSSRVGQPWGKCLVLASPPPRLLGKWPPFLKVLARAGVRAGPAAPTGLGQFCCQGPVLLGEAGRAFGWPKLGRKHFCREGRRLWGRQR